MSPSPLPQTSSWQGEGPTDPPRPSQLFVISEGRLYFCAEGQGARSPQSRMEKQSSGLTPSLPGEAGAALGRHSRHWLGARSSSGRSPFQEEEGEQQRPRGAGLGGKKPRPRNDSGAPSKVCGRPVHSFLLRVSHLSRAVFGCFPENSGSENYQIDHLLSFWFLAKPAEMFPNPRLMPLNNKQTSIRTSKQHLNIFC